MAQKQQPIILEREELTILPATTLAIIEEPLVSIIADLVDFAEGRIQRTALEAGLQAYALAIYEMQEDCPECAGKGTFLKTDGRLAWKCPSCGGKRWRWKVQP